MKQYLELLRNVDQWAISLVQVFIFTPDSGRCYEYENLGRIWLLRKLFRFAIAW